MMTTVDGLVSVRSIAKTFASGKTAERLLYHTLGEMALPSGRVRNIKLTFYIKVFIKNIYRNILVSWFQNDAIDLDVFTFDNFLKIYKDICPRSDIADLFNSM